MKTRLSYPDNFPRPINNVKDAASEIYKCYQANKKITKNEFQRIIKKISTKHGIEQIPSWALSLLFLRQGKLSVNLKKLLLLKSIRSESGIVPVSIFTKSTNCPAHCVFCPTEARIPKSYFSDEPAVMRAIRNKYDAFKQVTSRLMQLYLSGHSIDKIELIIQGGTFSAMDKKYRENFIKRAFDAANTDIKEYLINGNKSIKAGRSLNTAQKINEKAKQRIIGITVETRPDWINKQEVIFLRKLGVTRVELGVQCLRNDVLTKVKRGHNVESVISATRLLKDAGIKVCFHMMPGLPGSTPEKDLSDFRLLFNDERFQPDLLKIYPCVVTRDAELLQWFKSGGFTPYTDEILTNLLVEIKKIIPPYVRIQRLIRDIPKGDIIAGSLISNLRQGVQEKLINEGRRCRCVRCREVKIQNSKVKISDLTLRETRYQASSGWEYFLEYIDPENEILFALLRLRLPKDNNDKIFKVLEKSAIIRELHTYGVVAPIGKNPKNSVQHFGLGKLLIKRAEEIAKENKYKKIAVTSGVGTREYYIKLGYKLIDTYMARTFDLCL